MANWAFTPEYRFYLYQTPLHSETGWSQPRAFRLGSMMQIQASLIVAGQMGQMTAAFADTDGTLRRIVNPQPMNQVQLWLRSRCPGVGPQTAGPQFTGGWHIAWTGYVDTVEHTVDANQGSTLNLTCSTPHKLWETTLQEEGNAFLQFATAATANVSGSMMLEYTALQVGYRTQMLKIDPYADSGSGYSANALSQASWNPELQSWGSVLQGFLASAGLEFFFDEEGAGVWRRVAFIGQKPQARQMVTDEILTATLATSDQGLYTDIEVRPQFGGATGLAAETGPAGPTSALQGLQPGNAAVGFWPPRDPAKAEFNKTDTMRQHLGRRFFVAYAPWVTTNALGAADQLAKVLGYQAAAGALHGQVTLVADPQFKIGSIILIPPLRQDPAPWVIDQRALSDDLGTFYYVQSVTYTLTWGSAWFMTLGLAYGHSRHDEFPYLNIRDSKGQVAYPVYSLGQTANLNLEDRGFLSKETLSYFSFTVMPALPGKDLPPDAPRVPGLKDNEVGADPAIFRDGVEVGLKTSSGDQLPTGQTKNGYYKLRTKNVIKGNTAGDLLSGSGLTLYMNVPEPIFGVQMTDPSNGKALADLITNTAGTDGTDPTNYRAGTDPPGSNLNDFNTTGATYTSNLQTSGLVPPTAPGPAGLALAQAYTRAGKKYLFSHAGNDAWDCSGLVAWAYHQIGVDELINLNDGGSYNTDKGPDGIYSYFSAHGAQEIKSKDARPGDLLFVWLPPEKRVGEFAYAAKQNGYAHIAFSIGNDHNFGADGPNNTYNIGESDNSITSGEGGFNQALDMQSVRWDEIPGAPKVTAQKTGNKGGAVNTDANQSGTGTIAAKAYNLALTFADAPGESHYTQFTLGGQNIQDGVVDASATGSGVLSPGQVGADNKRQFDCAGLVAWCYHQCGYGWDGNVQENSDGSINYGNRNAGGIHQILAGRSDVTEIDVSKAQPGDLIFGEGFEHIGFCSGAGGNTSGTQFGANNYTLGISNQNMNGYTPTFAAALDMSKFTGK